MRWVCWARRVASASGPRWAGGGVFEEVDEALSELLGLVAVCEVPGVGEERQFAARHQLMCPVGVFDGDHGVRCTPGDQGGQAFDEVEAVGGAHSLAARVEDAAGGV